MTVQDILYEMFKEHGVLTTSDIARRFNGSDGLVCSSPMEQLRKMRVRLERGEFGKRATILAQKVSGKSIYRYTMVEL